MQMSVIRLGGTSSAWSREDLDQLQLVIEVRLEPRHVRPVAMAI
jgi:hypothetical protein